MPRYAVAEKTEEKATTPVLLLEPDQWRFRGMTTVLENAGDFEIVGERDYARILTAETAPEDLKRPAVSVIAQRLITEFGIALIPHVKDLFRPCSVLIHGDHESLESTASILAAGGSGFYSLNAPAHYLAKAVSLVADGKLWGPREAVAMMASRDLEPQMPDDELTLLQYLHEGLSNKEIANRLQVAEVTVKAKLGKLYKRFGVNTRLQLLAAAMKQGLVRSSGS